MMWLSQGVLARGIVAGCVVTEDCGREGLVEFPAPRRWRQAEI